MSVIFYGVYAELPWSGLLMPCAVAYISLPSFGLAYSNLRYLTNSLRFLPSFGLTMVVCFRMGYKYNALLNYCTPCACISNIQ